MDIDIANKLLAQQLISPIEFDNLQKQDQKPVSIYWDLTSLLYLGILLLTTGLGVLVYKNIDSIGHSVIIITIVVLCASCFAYCFNKSKGYSNIKVETPNFLFDFILLLGSLLLLTLVGYLQFQYNLFGSHWGMATFIPMVLLFAAAYYFDHLGVLSLAITNLAAWANISVAPSQFLKDNDFSDNRLIYTGIVLGAGLIVVSAMSVSRNIKAHFAFTYKNFGGNILLISLLAAMFNFHSIYLLWFIVLSAVTMFFLKDSLKEKLFYFFVITVLYAYIAVSYVAIDLIYKIGGSGGVLYLGLIYFIASGITLIRQLMKYNKIIKKDASI